MKKIAWIVWMTVVCTCAFAEQKEKALHFYYLTHDETTPVSQIYERLQSEYRDAKTLGDAYIFYLSNGDNPIIVQVNTADDNRAQFNTLLGELVNKLSHSVNPGVDAPTIIRLLQKQNLTDAHGKPAYSHVWIDFYVSSPFWQMGYQQSIISAVYFGLDMPRLLQPRLEFRVMRSQNDAFDYDETAPFGPMNFGGINDNFIMLEY